MSSRTAICQALGLQVRLWRQLSVRLQRRLLLGGVQAGLAAAAELIGLSLVPLLVGQLSRGQLQDFPLVAIGLPVLSVSLILRLSDLRWRYAFTARMQVLFGERLLRAQLLQQIHEAGKHSEASFTSSLTQDLVNLGSVVTYQLTLMANLLLTILIIIGLFWFSYGTTAVVLAIALAYYTFSTLITARWVHRLGVRALTAQQQLLVELRQLFGIAGSLFPHLGRPHLTRRTNHWSQELYASQARANTVISVPKVMIDHLVLAILLIVTAWLLLQAPNPEEIGKKAALILLYLIAFNRLLPSLQQIYLSLSTIGQNLPSLHRILLCLEHQQPRINQLIQIRDQTDSTFPVGRFHLALQALQPPNGRGEVTSFHEDGTLHQGLEGILQAGELHWLQGPSGIGKSTLMQVLAGYLHAGAGRILLDGIQIDPFLNPAWIKSVAYVPQQVFVLPLSLSENVTLQPVIGGAIDLIRLRSVLKLVRLNDLDPDDVLPDFNSGLSGGQQQRLALARALYQQPRLLILDEAITGIDSPTRLSILKALQQHISAYAICTVVISHDPLPIHVGSILSLKV